MNYGSVCSGIEAATVALHDEGFTPQWFSEIEPFPCKVLKHHYPHIPNLGDMTKLRSNPVFNESIIDLLIGGTPCQAFSVAGLRKGLDDQRGNLSLEYIRLLGAKRPRWFWWENVPGVLSSNEGRDFAAILSGWTGLDIPGQKFARAGIIQGSFYSLAWRILDAQYTGVPQRRRRIFVIGYLGTDWRPPTAVLFEPESLSGDIAQSGKKRKEAAGKIATSATETGKPVGYRMLAFGEYADDDSASTCKMRDYKDAIDLAVQNYVAFTQNQAGDVLTGDKMHSLGTSSSATARNAANVVVPVDSQPTPYNEQQILKQNDLDPRSGFGLGQEGYPAFTLQASHPHGFITSIARRLTPLECERLQGFPDNYTNIPGAKDSPRYKAIGNSMAVPCMKWIGKRMKTVDSIINSHFDPKTSSF
jgi:DNA (cytosine-5)-methyltransferase 1